MTSFKKESFLYEISIFNKIKYKQKSKKENVVVDKGDECERRR